MGCVSTAKYTGSPPAWTGVRMVTAALSRSACNHEHFKVACANLTKRI